MNIEVIACLYLGIMLLFFGIPGLIARALYTPEPVSRDEFNPTFETDHTRLK